MMPTVVAYGIETWRVYSAEQSIDAGQPFADIAEARAFIARVRTSSWVRSRFPGAGRVSTVLGGRQDENSLVSFARSVPELQATRHTISLHPQMLYPVIALHELAHCLTPKWDGDLRQLRRDRVVYGRRGDHDAMFTATLSLLVQRFGTGANRVDLAEAYEHYGVARATEDELLAARAHGRLVEAEVGRLWKETADEWNAERDDRRAAGEVVAEPVVPQFKWGFWCWMARAGVGARRRTTLKELVERVSRIERCTRKDITRIEDLEGTPDDPVDRRRCMALVAALNIDPIWARTALGLVRWECGVELDELRGVNPDWAATVDHLNDLLAARPPLWVSEGVR